VFQFALTLARGAISPAQPAASVSTAAAIAVCFAPEEDCAAFAVRAIDNAVREILVAAYRLTVGSGIVGALIRAKERGVDVRVIADRAAPCGRATSSRWPPLACRFGSTIERASRMPKRWL
jgi:phosphatidylserine/phosphatidylglycerophosphate/cardiolipin synthase-like enzyme